MNMPKTPVTTETSLTQDLLYAAEYYLGGRKGLILLTVVALGAGAALNWNWFVAIGVAPLLLAVAPCAAMCALGLCLNKAMGKSCSKELGGSEESDTRPKEGLTTADESDAVGEVSPTITQSKSPTSITAVTVGSRHSAPLDKRRS